MPDLVLTNSNRRSSINSARHSSAIAQKFAILPNMAIVAGLFPIQLIFSHQSLARCGGHGNYVIVCEKKSTKSVYPQPPRLRSVKSHPPIQQPTTIVVR